MCNDLSDFMEWFYQNYSAVLGLYRPYIAVLGDVVIAGIHYTKASPVAGGVPVGVVVHGSSGVVKVYCSLPIACAESESRVVVKQVFTSTISRYEAALPLKDELGFDTICLNNTVTIIKEIVCDNIYNYLSQYIILCGLLNKWARVGGNVAEEFWQFVSRL